MERLCNLIVQELGYDQTLRLYKKIVNDKKANVYFNLNSRNTSFFKDILEERVVKKRIFLEIESAIKNSIEVKIVVKKEIYNILPI